MKKFIYRRGLEHLLEATILFSTIDKNIAAKINSLSEEIAGKTNLDKTKLENKLKELIDG